MKRLDTRLSAVRHDSAAAALRLAQLVPDLATLGDEGRWLAAALAAYLDPHSELRLEEALGLAVIGQGGESWRAAARRAERDAAIREIGLIIAGSLRERAAQVRRELRRYRDRWQRDDRHRSQTPPEYAGTFHRHLYAAFAASEHVPTGLTRLRDILSCSEERPILAGRLHIRPATPAGNVPLPVK